LAIKVILPALIRLLFRGHLSAVRIRALNDELRQNLAGGVAVMTPGIAALGQEAVDRIVKTIAVFDDFCHAFHQWWTLKCEGRWDARASGHERWRELTRPPSHETQQGACPETWARVWTAFSDLLA
jgi:hypothetical protein